MNSEKKQNPVAVILGLAKECRGKFILSVLLAILGVIAGVIPFIMGAKVIVALMQGVDDIRYFSYLCMISLISYICKTVFANLSTSISHEATFETLKSIRKKMIAKQPSTPAVPSSGHSGAGCPPASHGSTLHPH